jgi:hypothetical protein
MRNRSPPFAGEVQVRSAKCGVDRSQVALRSPGLLEKHYSPKATLVILNWRDDADLNSQLSTSQLSTFNCFIIAHTKIPSGEIFAGVSVIPHDAEAFARAIYAELHRCDGAGAGGIVVEAPPEFAGVGRHCRPPAARGGVREMVAVRHHLNAPAGH